MASYTIVISGTGGQHEADRAAREAVEALRQAGHTIENAAITVGVQEQLPSGATRAVAGVQSACGGDYVVLRLEDGSEAVMTGKQLEAIAR